MDVVYLCTQGVCECWPKWTGVTENLCANDKTDRLLELGQYDWRGDTVFCCHEHFQCRVTHGASRRKSPVFCYFLYSPQNSTQEMLTVHKNKSAWNMPPPTHNTPGWEVLVCLPQEHDFNNSKNSNNFRPMSSCGCEVFSAFHWVPWWLLFLFLQAINTYMCKYKYLVICIDINKKICLRGMYTGYNRPKGLPSRGQAQSHPQSRPAKDHWRSPVQQKVPGPSDQGQHKTQPAHQSKNPPAPTKRHGNPSWRCASVTCQHLQCSVPSCCLRPSWDGVGDSRIHHIYHGRSAGTMIIRWQRWGWNWWMRQTDRAHVPDWELCWEMMMLDSKRSLCCSGSGWVKSQMCTKMVTGSDQLLIFTKFRLRSEIPKLYLSGKEYLQH